jgi:hypothetical protein
MSVTPRLCRGLAPELSGALEHFSTGPQCQELGSVTNRDVEKLPARLEAEIGAQDSVFNHRADIEPVSDRKVRVRGIGSAGLQLAALTIFAYSISLYWVIYFVGLILS